MEGRIKRFWLFLIFATMIICSCASKVNSLIATGAPIKYISSCEIDFNNNGKPDIALLIEFVAGRKLIVLMKTEKSYDAYLLSSDKRDMNLGCHYGTIVRESEAVKGNGKSFTTPGTYIELSQPEGSSVVYFWNGNGFTEVWTSD